MRSRIRRYRDSDYWLWMEVFAIVTALVLFVPTAISLWIDLGDRQQQRIAQAWELVTNKAPGNSGKGPAMRYLIDQGVPLVGIDLSVATNGGRSYLHSADLSGAILRDANLSGADLSKSDLSNVDLTNADLSQANMQGAILSNAIADGAKLIGADLRHSEIVNASFLKAQFQNSKLAFSDLSGTDFSVSDFTNADLTGVNLTAADIGNVKISGASLFGANLTQTSILHTDFTETLIFYSPKLTSAIGYDPITYRDVPAWVSKTHSPIGPPCGSGIAWGHDSLPEIGLTLRNGYTAELCDE